MSSQVERLPLGNGKNRGGGFASGDLSKEIDYPANEPSTMCNTGIATAKGDLVDDSAISASAGGRYLLRQFSTPGQSKKPIEFTLFHKLPPELQLNIWKLAVPGPRTIGIRVSDNIDIFRPCNLLDVSSFVPVPALLHVNSDSRCVALKVFEKRFASFKRPFGYTFLDFNTDTLSFDLHTAQKVAMTEDTGIVADRGLIQHVEIRFKLAPTIEICDAIASVVITGQVRSWPSIKTWSFPGTEPIKATLIELMFTRTSDDKDAEAIVSNLALIIKAAFDESLNKGAPAVAFKFSRVDTVSKGTQAM